jgi:formate dehydrogenase iron-sulfur subunit
MVADASAIFPGNNARKREPVRLPLVQQYQTDQQRLTAVERFSQRHDKEALGPGAKYYKDLLPLERPGPGQQLAFQVDLDACSGCKACVTACHQLNGLDDEEGETWRSVGLLHGGSPEAPVQQTVTTACHHCVDPGCMKGCPVGAYEKDPITGIVKHLDDQCIGCQYCTLTCPYEVPQYSKKRGIVRKCDMCSDRLAEGEAPACVQACPNEAISIRIVDTARMLEDAQSEAFLPGAPSPTITVPTTTYKSRRPLPRNVLPADFHRVTSSHPAHAARVPAGPDAALRGCVRRRSRARQARQLRDARRGATVPVVARARDGSARARGERVPPRTAAVRLPRDTRHPHVLDEP